ncbi:MAG: YraN family protein [Thermoleophilia bacterium]
MGEGHEAGRAGERAAGRHMIRRGWRIEAAGWRGAGGELDLVVSRGSVVAVCEVKTRADPEALREPVTAAQRARIARAAEAFMAGRPDLAGRELRLDLITVRRGRLRARVRHHPGAIEAPP